MNEFYDLSSPQIKINGPFRFDCEESNGRKKARYMSERKEVKYDKKEGKKEMQ